MGDIETMSRKSQETKKLRKRVNTSSKKQKKQKNKMTDKTYLDKMVKILWMLKLVIYIIFVFNCQVLLLMSKTGLTEDAIRSQHSSFLKECPNGEMKKEMFVELSAVTCPNPEQDVIDFLTGSSWR